MAKKKTSKSVFILRLIRRSGSKGLKLVEIQRALWQRSHGHEQPFNKRSHRGYWCSNLLGGVYRYGLLRIFCERTADARWRWRNGLKHIPAHVWTFLDGPGQATQPEEQ
jgi:hypothetical protein